MPNEQFASQMQIVRESIKAGRYLTAKQALINLLSEPISKFDYEEKRQLIHYISLPVLAPKDMHDHDEYKTMMSKKEIDHLKKNIVTLVTDVELFKNTPELMCVTAILSLCEDTFVGHLLHTQNGVRKTALDRGTLCDVASWLNKYCTKSPEKIWLNSSRVKNQSGKWHDEMLNFSNIAKKIGSEQILKSLNQKSFRY